MWTLRESVRLSASPMTSKLATTVAFVVVAASRPTMSPMLVTIAAGPPKLRRRKSGTLHRAREGEPIKVASDEYPPAPNMLFPFLRMRFEEPQRLVERARKGRQKIRRIGVPRF